jgi:ABC-type phosphate/phosphonate transport system permease subunit
MWGFTDWVLLLADTLLIAYVGTVLGGVVALLLSFPAAATLAPPEVATTRSKLRSTSWPVPPGRRTPPPARGPPA